MRWPFCFGAAGTAGVRVTAQTTDQDRLPDTGADYGQRVALYFAAMFVIYGVLIPFLPVWLDGRGLTANEVAIVTAVPFILRLAVTPAVAIFADRLGAHRLFIIASAWAALAACLMLGGIERLLAYPCGRGPLVSCRRHDDAARRGDRRQRCARLFARLRPNAAVGLALVCRGGIDRRRMD